MPEGSTNILLRRMIDGTVPAELATDRRIDCAFIRHHVRCPIDVLYDDRAKGFCRHARNANRLYRTIPLNQRKHRSLRRNIPLPVGRFAADISFISFYNLVLTAEWPAVSVFHAFANA